MIKVFGKSKEKTTDAPMGSAEYGKFIRAAYMDTVNEAVILSDDLDESLSRYDEIVSNMSKLKSEKEMIDKSTIKNHISKSDIPVTHRTRQFKHSFSTICDNQSQGIFMKIEFPCL